jgi:hypothetical protein
MSNAPSPPKPRRKPEPAERRAPRGAPGSLRWLRGLLSRPLALERRGLQWHVVLGDRRQAGSVGRPPTLNEVNEELRTRLMAQDVDRAARVMRHLVFVHDELRRKGWRGVEALPALVLGKALVQAQMLASDEASPVLAHAVERLHLMHVGAQLREERKALLQADGTARVEVSEATQEEFDEIERSWLGTLSPAAIPPRGEPGKSAQ